MVQVAAGASFAHLLQSVQQIQLYAETGALPTLGPARRLQPFIGVGRWPARVMSERRQELAAETVARAEGGVIVDGRGFRG